MTTLRIEKLSKSFGGFRALSDVNLVINPCERHAIVGPNGAGKTTLFNIINGQLKPSSGQIFLDEKDVTGFKPPKMCGRKVGRTFQKNNLFLGLTVAQNTRLAVHAQCNLGKRLFLPSARSRQVDQEIERVLEQVDLSSHREKLAGDMAYGEQRQLELAIALAGRPEILLLDEPTAGMSPVETREMIRMLRGLPREVSLLLIEHDMDVVFALAERITVLHLGEILAQGTPEEIERDKRVLEVYLGGGRKRRQAES
jgi:branched-chain amino acid transport system ATP-binding protein